MARSLLAPQRSTRYTVPFRASRPKGWLKNARAPVAARSAPKAAGVAQAAQEVVAQEAVAQEQVDPETLFEQSDLPALRSVQSSPKRQCRLHYGTKAVSPVKDMHVDCDIKALSPLKRTNLDFDFKELQMYD